MTVRAGLEGVARPERPRRCTLPITALRVTPPSCLAIWLADRPSSQSIFSVTTRSSVQPISSPFHTRVDAAPLADAISCVTWAAPCRPPTRYSNPNARRHNRRPYVCPQDQYVESGLLAVRYGAAPTPCPQAAARRAQIAEGDSAT